MTLEQYQKITGLDRGNALKAMAKGIDPQVYVEGLKPKQEGEYFLSDIEFLLGIPKSTLLSMRKYGDMPETHRRIIADTSGGKWSMLWNDDQLQVIKKNYKPKEKKKFTITGDAVMIILFNSGRTHLYDRSNV